MTNQCDLTLTDAECRYVNTIRQLQDESNSFGKILVMTIKPDEILLNETSNRGRVTLRRRNGHRSGN